LTVPIKLYAMLAVYVDDILIAGAGKEIFKIKSLIKKNFKATDTDEVDYIIDIKFVKCDNDYLIRQREYLKNILNKFEINKYKPVTSTLPIENDNS